MDSRPVEDDREPEPHEGDDGDDTACARRGGTPQAPNVERAVVRPPETR